MDFYGFSSILGGSGARGFAGLWRPVAACGGLWQPVATCGSGAGSPLETFQSGGRGTGQAGQAGRAGRAGREARQAGRQASRQVGRQAD